MLVLFTTFWIPEHQGRRAEIFECVRRNVDDSRIAKIHIVTEVPRSDIAHHAELHNEKLEWHFVEARPTFAVLFSLTKCVEPDTIVIIANSDIYFGRGLENLESTLRPTDALALSRFDRRADGVMVPFHRPDSQDAWILRAPLRDIYADFPLGIPGCDNRLAHELTAAGHTVTNACNDFELVHVHASNVRSYTAKGPKVGPPYLQITPRPKGYWASFKRFDKVPVEVKPPPARAAPDVAPQPEPLLMPTVDKLFFMPEGLDLVPRSPWTLESIVHFGLPFTAMTKAFQLYAKKYTYIALEPKQSAVERLLDACKRIRPDVVFMQIQSEGIVGPTTMARIKEVCKTIVNWTGDVRSPLPHWFIELAPHVSWTLFSNMNDVRALQMRGLRSAFWQIGYDEDVYKPPTGPSTRSGVVFMGNNYKSTFPLSTFREQLVKALQTSFGTSFVLHGANWTNAKANSNNNQGEEVKALQRCTIAVSASHFQYERYYSDRLLRFMACGPLVLQHWYPGLEKDFIPDTHLVVFNDIPECIQKVRHYMEHPDVAARIGAAGAAHVLANHSQKVRIMELQAVLDGPCS